MRSLTIIQILVRITKLNIIIFIIEHMTTIFKLSNILIIVLNLKIGYLTRNMIKCSINIIIIVLHLTQINIVTIRRVLFQIMRSFLPFFIVAVLTSYLHNSFKRLVGVYPIVVISCTIHSITERTLIISLLIDMIVNSSYRLVSFVARVVKWFCGVELLFLIRLISFLKTLTLSLSVTLELNTNI